MKNSLTRWWHAARRPLTGHRAAYVALNRLRPSRSELLVRADSSLLIEGPMRSGNTYAVAAFRFANGDDHHIGRHMHAAAHVLEAARLEVPTLILVREPVDACISHVLRRPALTLSQSLVDYASFYDKAAPVRDSTVVVPFETLISDFGSAIRVLNRRFGTAFVPYENTPVNEEQVRLIVEDMHRAESGSDGSIDEMRVSRPSSFRTRAKERQLEMADRPHLRGLVSNARSVHADWVAKAVQDFADTRSTER